MVFKIGNNDYSSKVLMDTYNVNRIDVYTEWDDANGKTHRDIYRTRIEGSFDMQISSISEYRAFINDIKTRKSSGGYVPCKVCVNNLDQESVSVNMFIDYAPIRTMNNDYTKGYMSFTVNVKER